MSNQSERGVELNQREINRLYRMISMGMENVVLSAWRHARNRHAFKNQTGELERSIRVEKAVDSVHGRTTIYRYRLAAGVGESTGPEYNMYAQGRPGGMGTTARGRKVKTGRIVAGEIVFKSKKARGKHYRAYKREGASEAYYAIYVELGTSKMAARPFLRPAVTAQRAKIRRLFQSVGG